MSDNKQELLLDPELVKTKQRVEILQSLLSVFVQLKQGTGVKYGEHEATIARIICELKRETEKLTSVIPTTLKVLK